MADVLGKDCYFYRNTNTYNSPSWNLVDNVIDLDDGLEVDEIDVTVRASGGWEMTAMGKKKLSYSFKMIWDPSDADLQAFRDAFNNRTTIDVVKLDGLVATPGSQGPRAVCVVTKFTRSEPLVDAATVDIMLRPAKSTNLPSWHTVS